MIYCNQCGTENAETGKFCKQCGSPLLFTQEQVFQHVPYSNARQNIKRPDKRVMLIVVVLLVVTGVISMGYKQGWFTGVACGTMFVQTGGITYGTVLAEDGRCWLDRNLGAKEVATSPTDTDAYGWYFQWGRGADGHQLPASETTTTQSPSDDPGHAKLILPTTGTDDWRNPPNNDLWQGVDSTNNPCPAGFRVPTQPEWQELILKANITDSRSAFESKLKLTTGSHSRATSYSPDASAYWTSSPDKDGVKAYYVNLSKTLNGFVVNTVGATNKLSNFPVRCISNSGGSKQLEISDIAELIHDGKYDEAKNVLNGQYGTVAVYETYLVNEWSEAKQYDVLAQIFEEMVRKVPDNIQFKTSLAFVYSEMGHKDESVTLLQNIIVSNPENADQINEYIRQVKSSIDNTTSPETDEVVDQEDEAAKADRDAQIESGMSMAEYSEYMRKNYPLLTEAQKLNSRLYTAGICDSKKYPDDDMKRALCIYVQDPEISSSYPDNTLDAQGIRDALRDKYSLYVNKQIINLGYDPSDYEIIYIDDNA